MASTSSNKLADAAATSTATTPSFFLPSNSVSLDIAAPPPPQFDADDGGIVTVPTRTLNLSELSEPSGDAAFSPALGVDDDGLLSVEDDLDDFDSDMSIGFLPDPDYRRDLPGQQTPTTPSSSSTLGAHNTSSNSPAVNLNTAASSSASPAVGGASTLFATSLPGASSSAAAASTTPITFTTLSTSRLAPGTAVPPSSSSATVANESGASSGVSPAVASDVSGLFASSISLGAIPVPPPTHDDEDDGHRTSSSSSNIANASMLHPLPQQKASQVPQQRSDELLPATPMNAAPVVIPPETIDKLATGFVGTSGDFFAAIEARLKTLLQSQEQLIAAIVAEQDQIQNIPGIQEAVDTFSLLPGYTAKATQIRKDMQMLGAKTQRLASRAEKLKQRKEQDDLAEAEKRRAQRKKELERENLLLAKPASHLAQQQQQ